MSYSSNQKQQQYERKKGKPYSSPLKSNNGWILLSPSHRKCMKKFIPADYLKEEELSILAACAANDNVEMPEMITMGEMFKKIALERYEEKYGKAE